eukprot:1415958-Amphidinium_carterae.1
MDIPVAALEGSSKAHPQAAVLGVIILDGWKRARTTKEDSLAICVKQEVTHSPGPGWLRRVRPQRRQCQCRNRRGQPQRGGKRRHPQGRAGQHPRQPPAVP